MTTINTVHDLSDWVRRATANWDGRTGDDVTAIVVEIMDRRDRPRFGADWSAFLEALPDLTTFLPE